MATFVTAFFDVAKFEGNEKRRAGNSYLADVRSLLDHPQIPHMVVFVEPENAAAVREMITPSKHTVVEKPIGELPGFRRYREIVAARKAHPVANADLVKYTPAYVLAIWARFDLVLEAMRLDPYKSSHFAWVDFGIQHGRAGEGLFKGSAALGITDHEKVKLMLVRYAPPTGKDYSANLDSVAAGYFSGGRGAVAEFCATMVQEREQLLDQGWAPTEEQVLHNLVRARWDSFVFYFGTYTSIFRNYEFALDGAAYVVEIIRQSHNRQDWQFLVAAGDYLWRSYPAGQTTFSIPDLHRFLDCYFIGLYWVGRKDDAREIKREYAKLRSIADFAEQYAREKGRMDSNFSFV